MDRIDPLKAVTAARLNKVPPLICLACLKSDVQGKCTDSRVNLARVEIRWRRQLILGPDYHENIFPNTRLTKICKKVKLEKIKI